MDFRDHACRRRAGILNVDVRPGPRSLESVRQENAEDANLHACEFAYHELGRIGKCSAGLLINYVSGQPFKMRLADAGPQHLRTEIELVIAKGGIVEPTRIPRFDHLLALVGV